MSDHNITYHTGTTAETVVYAGNCRLIGLVADATTTGTVTLRNAAETGGSNVFHVAAIGMLQSGKQFSQRGVRLEGLTIALTVSGDKIGIIWAPKHV